MAKPGLEAFFADESGATGIEYALIGSIVSIGIVVSLTSATTSLQAMFNKVVAAFQ
jgi:pilus assembly protein Flp/PilA